MLYEYGLEVNRCQGDSAFDDRQCMRTDDDRQFFFLYSESIADWRRRQGRKAILSRLSASRWADRPTTATLGTHCMPAGHAGAAGETASSARPRTGSSSRRLVSTRWVVSSLFRLLSRNDRHSVPSTAIRLIVTPDVARSISLSIARFFCHNLFLVAAVLNSIYWRNITHAVPQSETSDKTFLLFTSDKRRLAPLTCHTVHQTY